MLHYLKSYTCILTLKCTFQLDTVLNFSGLCMACSNRLLVIGVFISTTLLCQSNSDGLSWTTVLPSAIFSVVLLAVFVDDILIASDSDDTHIHVKGAEGQSYRYGPRAGVPEHPHHARAPQDHHRPGAVCAQFSQEVPFV
jgi:hypothetical protein